MPAGYRPGGALPRGSRGRASRRRVVGGCCVRLAWLETFRLNLSRGHDSVCAVSLNVVCEATPRGQTALPCRNMVSSIFAVRAAATIKDRRKRGDTALS